MRSPCKRIHTVWQRHLFCTCVLEGTRATKNVVKLVWIPASRLRQVFDVRASGTLGALVLYLHSIRYHFPTVRVSWSIFCLYRSLPWDCRCDNAWESRSKIKRRAQKSSTRHLCCRRFQRVGCGRSRSICYHGVFILVCRGTLVAHVHDTRHHSPTVWVSLLFFCSSRSLPRGC